MSSDGPSFISLFSGIGGSSLGYSQSGFRELLAIDSNAHAREVFTLNFPTVPILDLDLSIPKISTQVMDAANITPGRLDLLDGSPPCQGFSSVGRRNTADSRNDLIRAYQDLILEIAPKVAMMENVPGLVTGQMRGYAKAFLDGLSHGGYRVKMKILNAMHYGVAQSRKRVIVIAVRDDLQKDPIFPEHETPRPITVRQAFEGVRAEPTPPLGNMIQPVAKIIVPGTRLADLRATRLPPRNRGESYYGVRRLHWDRPSYTIIKTFSTGAAGMLHPDGDRWCSIPELMRLHGFPDDFQMVGTYPQQFARIGNSVPPPLAKAIGKRLYREYFETGLS